MNHHYLPESYLRAWSGPDHKLTRYARIFGDKISVERWAPASVGSVKDLYALPMLPEHLKQGIEQIYMQRIDDAMVKPLTMLKRGEIPVERRDREAWAIFIASLYFRIPEAVEALDGNFAANWKSADADFRRHLQKQGLSDTEIEHLYSSAEHLDPRFWSKISLVDFILRGRPVGETMELEWVVITIDVALLMTSDCPLMLQRDETDLTLNYLALALSPHTIVHRIPQPGCLYQSGWILADGFGRALQWLSRGLRP